MNHLAFFSLFVALVSLSETLALASDPHVVTVDGSCLHHVVSDRASITLTVEVTDMDLKVASQKAAHTYEQTRDAVKRLGLEDLELQTSEYNVGENREWIKNSSVFKGYRVRMGLYVATSQIQRLGEVIAIASQEEIKDVGGLTSFLSDEKAKHEHLNCLEEAAQDAKSRAERLAQSLGSKVGTVTSITETESGPPHHPIPFVSPMFAARAALGGDGAPPPPAVEAGEQAINVQVQVQFSLNP